MSMRWLRFMLMTRRRKRAPGTKEKVVVEGCTLGFAEITAQGVVQMIAGESQKVFSKENGRNGVYRGDAQFQINAGAISNGCMLTAPHIDSFHPAADRTKVDKLRPLRTTDKKIVMTPGVVQSFPLLSCTFKATVEVKDANQSKIKMA